MPRGGGLSLVPLWFKTDLLGGDLESEEGVQPASQPVQNILKGRGQRRM